ncbi:MAG: VCBS repeat-containing protein [Candidatus Hydrogenedentales bacterium]|jgi:hypothetical protein
MIAALVPLVLCGLTFVEQDIPDVTLYAADGFSGQRDSNFLRADFDGDGTLDLLLPTYLAFQRGGGFSKTQTAPIPDFGESPHCDLWGRDIYLCLSDRIEIIRWDGTQWRRILSQQLIWPRDCRFKTFSTTFDFEDPKALRFHKFLQDLDGDGKPEIIVPARDAVHVYRQGELFFEDAAQWSVYPAKKVQTFEMEPIWPPRNRIIRPLNIGWNCDLYVSGSNLVVETVENLSSPTKQLRSVHRPMTFDTGFAMLGEPEPPRVYRVPSNTYRCRLNDDDVADFAGSQRERSKTGPVPIPVLTLTVSTDGGASWTTLRTTVSQQQCYCVDINADGRLDLIAESSGLYQGGLREQATSFLTGKTVSQNVNVVPQQPDGKFIQDKAIRKRFTIQLDAPPMQNSPMFRAYQIGCLIDLTGDFTGDGLLDLAIHEAPERIAVYPFTGTGFATAPLAVLATKPDWMFAVGDVDGDKRADIVLSGPESTDADVNTVAMRRLFLSRETAP